MLRKIIYTQYKVHNFIFTQMTSFQCTNTMLLKDVMRQYEIMIFVLCIYGIALKCYSRECFLSFCVIEIGLSNLDRRSTTDRRPTPTDTDWHKPTLTRVGTRFGFPAFTGLGSGRKSGLPEKRQRISYKSVRFGTRDYLNFGSRFN